jgi:outer membrane protein assembly factor BamB
MTRRLMSAWVGLVLAASVAQAELPFSKEMLPSRPALARLELDRQWYNVVPLEGGAEQVLELSIDDRLVFAQTNHANFHVFDSESGRLLWSANFGNYSVDAFPASSNSSKVFATNSNTLYALDRQTGQVAWKKKLDHLPGSSTACDEDRVWVGTLSGKLHAYSSKDGAEVWNLQTRGEISSRPHPAGQVIAFASQDGRVYANRTDRNVTLWKWAAGGKLVAPLGAFGTRTLLVPSVDNSLYAVDLFTGETKWNYPTGAPIEQEPLVAGDEAYVVNTAGLLSSVNAKDGSLNWAIPTLGGPLLGVTGKRVYVESRDGDLFIVDRKTGQMLFDPRATHERAGVNFRPFELGPTNRLNDRIYVGSKSGMIICFRESGSIKPVPLRDPKEKPFGYIPPEGYPDAQPTPPLAPAASKAADDAAPKEDKADAAAPKEEKAADPK